MKVLQSKCLAATAPDMSFPTFGAGNTQITSSSSVVASVPDYGTVVVAVTNQGIATVADCGPHTVTATDSSDGDVSSWVAIAQQGSTAVWDFTFTPRGLGLGN